MGCINQFDVKQLASEFGLSVFIETGTGKGSSLNYILETGVFGKNISFEVNPLLYEECLFRFKGKNCHIFNTDSVTGLDDLLIDIDESILFWLDAHFPNGADFGMGNYNGGLPLERELDVIRKHRVGNDVIIIDDLRIYEDGPFINGNWADRTSIGGNNIDFIQPFLETHTLTKDFRDEGYIILKPKW